MPPDNILFSKDPAADLQLFLNRKGYSSIAILVDNNTSKHCYPLLKRDDKSNVIIVPSGEEAKNIETCVTVWEELTKRMLDRHACVVVIGGGVLGDMGGFCASTYKRGIDFILIPTTLLAQSDASIGGKLGIDFKNFKNHIGVFQEPSLTLLYSGFLKSLPKAELTSGFAEVIKHTLIGDRAMWSTISKRTLEQQDWETLIKHSVEFKSRITHEDPKEKGLRKILNAGHTIGHALESHLLSKGNRVLHGEAVAIGLITEGFIAQAKSLLTKSEFDSLRNYIVSIFGKISVSKDDIENVCKLVLQDKKNKDNRILCVLLNGIGDAKWDYEISVDEVRTALEYYQSC
ncbi:MAG: 3-dehydroquinate synthase [Chryseolinea sp.]